MRYIDIKRLGILFFFLWSSEDSYILLQVKNFDYEGDSSNSGAPYPVPYPVVSPPPSLVLKNAAPSPSFITKNRFSYMVYYGISARVFLSSA